MMAGHESPQFSTLQRYGIALLSIAVAFPAAFALGKSNFRDAEVPLFLFAVALSAWYGGPGPAAVAVFSSCALFVYFFTEPLYSFSVRASDVPYLVLFVAFASLMAWFSTLRRRVETSLREARDKLEVEVAERTQQASLLNLTHDSIFVRDLSGQISYWNRGAQELYGWSMEEAIGKRTHDLLQTVFPVPIEEII